jgi:hypothetical protein
MLLHEPMSTINTRSHEVTPFPQSLTYKRLQPGYLYLRNSLPVTSIIEQIPSR